MTRLSNQVYSESVYEVRVMVIQRVRNPNDDSQYVDIAETIGYWTQTGEGKTFQRTYRDLQIGYQLGDPKDRSEPIIVRSRADLEAAAELFRADHPD